MTARVAVVDYGMGNLYSVCRALEHVGAEAVLTEDPRAVLEADRVVLPGVGAFRDGMDELARRGLVPALREYAAGGRMMLGICLGMQMLFDESEEFGRHMGLAIIPGAVRAIPAAGADGKPHKIPHVGWSAVRPPATTAHWTGTLLEGTAEGTDFYFVHSYTGVPESHESRLADADYDGCIISAAVRRGNVYGFQFHPEKSGQAGLNLLQRFISVNAR
ncbi:MAG TPA: imidazole glycerol phosphate synthase subunit HisH [Burkholderiales bacterium]|nr:imidazole glycerol phosphate synthase subunit HisH [Burkholderiales bacterium]